MTTSSHIWNTVPELNTEPPYPIYSPSFTHFWLEEFLAKTTNNLTCINILLLSFPVVRLEKSLFSLKNIREDSK